MAKLGPGRTSSPRKSSQTRCALPKAPASGAVIAPTYGDARDTCIEAESGLLAALGTTRAEVVAGRSPLVELWNRSLGELRLRDGAVVYADGADDGALRIQGTNLRGVWADEVGLWRNWRQAWDESIAFALRKGAARLIATATPKSDMGARDLVRRLLDDSAVISRRLRTEDNRANLSDSFWERVSLTAGSRLSRQELEGELLEDVEGALWKRAWIDDARGAQAPYGGYRAVVVGLDPADGGAQGAEQALTVAAAGVDGQLYVIASEGMRDTPLRWLSHAVRVAREHSARIVLEKNPGGGFLVGLLEQTIDAMGVRVPYQVVDARSGKLTRAEPVAALYEQGKVSHLGYFPELEEQLVNFTGAPGERSPDRCDATVWALLELMGYARPQAAPAPAGAQSATATTLAACLAGQSRGPARRRSRSRRSSCPRSAEPTLGRCKSDPAGKGRWSATTVHRADQESSHRARNPIPTQGYRSSEYYSSRREAACRSTATGQGAPETYGCRTAHEARWHLDAQDDKQQRRPNPRGPRTRGLPRVDAWLAEPDVRFEVRRRPVVRPRRGVRHHRYRS